jgi:anaerobic selenocysteine-containing dehydrogenase
VLIGRRGLRSNNSWMHNSQRLVKGPDACQAWMHPADATQRGLRDGASVRLSSRVGSVVAVLHVTDRIGQGVVSLPHGWGHGRLGAQLAVAASRPGVSLNDLTDETHVDALSGNAAFSGVPVRVEASEAASSA